MRVLDTDGGSFCHEESCQFYFRNSQVISQAELRAGLILRFQIIRVVRIDVLQTKAVTVCDTKALR